MSAESPSRVGPPRRELLAFGEYFAICGLAVAQPLFDLLGKNARLFIAWRATPVTALLAVLAILVLVPLACWTIEVTVGAVAPKARSWVHTILLAFWFGVFAVELVKRAGDPSTGLVTAVGVTVGVAGAAAVRRFPIARSWLRLLVVAPVLFAVLFVAASPATPVLFSSEPGMHEARVARPSRVVVILLDEMPLESILDGAGRIDAASFPNLARLASGATWYRNSTTVSPWTELAVPALLTGRMPTDSDAVPAAFEYPDNLFTLLGRRYELNVHESVTRLCPSGACRPARRLAGVHPGFAGMLGDIASIWVDIAQPAPASRVFSAGIGGEDYFAWRGGQEFLRSLTAAEGPRLDFAHVLLPHFPWHYLPGGEDYAAFPPLRPGIVQSRWLDAEFASGARQRHLLQTAAADTLIGQVLDRLDSLGELDDSLVVVTADHGVAFREQLPFRGAAPSTYESIMWTPLFIKYPGQTVGRIDDRPARSVDVLPTIADTLGVRLPFSTDGRSLRGRARRPGPVPLVPWAFNTVDPEPGQDFVWFDGVDGFATVLERRAVPWPSDDPLRLYRHGPFSELVGASAWDLAVPGAEVAQATIVDPLRYQVVDRRAAEQPWATVQGRVSLPGGRPVALAANGRVVGVYTTRALGRGWSEYGGMVAPLLRDATNLMQLFAVDGSPSAPVLRPIGWVETPG